jgi:hypothetical protein
MKNRKTFGRRISADASAAMISSILNRSCTVTSIRSGSVNTLLSEHVFSSEAQRTDALIAYCKVVLTKELRKAVFISIDNPSSAGELKLELSIEFVKRKYKDNFEEFTKQKGSPLPYWYTKQHI